jgi:hypothetical protein
MSTNQPDCQVLARIQKGGTAEVLVTRQRYKGRSVIDVRVWWIPEGESELRPSGRGVTFDAAKLPQLIEALAKAHNPSHGSPETDRYSTITCANPECARRLVADTYKRLPDATVDRSRVHNIYDPNAPLSLGVFCTCGHYTVYSRSPPKPK